MCSFAYIMNVWKFFKGVYGENYVIHWTFSSFFITSMICFYFLAILSIFSLIKIHKVEKYQETKSSISRQGKLYLRFALLNVWYRKKAKLKSNKKTYWRRRGKKSSFSLFTFDRLTIHTHIHTQKFRQWILFYSCFCFYFIFWEPALFMRYVCVSVYIRKYKIHTNNTVKAIAAARRSLIVLNKIAENY